jgi:hypothetical protein
VISQDPFIMGPRTEGEAPSSWVDNPAEVLPFLTLLTPVFPSLYLVT